MVEYTDADITKCWEDLFAREEYRRKIAELIEKFPDTRSFLVDFRDIESTDMDFAKLLLDEPDRCLELGENAIRDMNEVFSDERHKVHLRLNHLPQDVKLEIRKIRACHLGKLVAVDGLARKVTVVNPKAIKARFTCARCGQEIWVPQHGTLLTRPFVCPNPNGTCNKGANSFELDEKNSVYIDSQFIEIQESPEGLRGGQQPERKTCYADDDLCGEITTGNRITVNGIVRNVEKKDSDKTTLFETYLEIISVEFEQHEYDEIKITDEDERAIKQMSEDPKLFDNLVQSISPTIHGLTEVKQAITLQLFGGCHKVNDDGSEIRGDMHILLVGDPGVAKSQILRYMTNLAPRSIYASGKSASGAGLTAAVVKDNEFGDGRWNLEAGALVLADKGLACIDELDKMTSEDRSSLHEAMESQRISFAKAGITATLQCRCSMLAAANPKLGRFDSTQRFASQIDLPPALISRFDLIFVLTDKSEKKKDRQMAEFIVGVHQRGEVKLRGDNLDIQGVNVNQIMEESDKYRPVYQPELIRKYVAYAKRITPLMSDAAKEKIVNKFVEIRSLGENGVITITARQLEAFVRLQEASARMKLSPIVTEEDADRAIQLVEGYIRSIAGTNQDGSWDFDNIGNSYSSNDRSELGIIKGIISSEPSGIDKLDLISKAQEEGISEENVNKFLKVLQDSGAIYNPKSNCYKVINE